MPTPIFVTLLIQQKKRCDVVVLPFTNTLERGIAKEIKERWYWYKAFSSVTNIQKKLNF